LLQRVAETFHKVLIVKVHSGVSRCSIRLILSFRVTLGLRVFKHVDCGVGLDLTLCNIWHEIIGSLLFRLLLSFLLRS